MSKIISVWKKTDFEHGIENRLYEICKHLEPDNIQANAPEIHVKNNWAYGIMNPTSAFLKKDSGILMGGLYGEFPEWDAIGEGGIDGSFAIFRDAPKFGEICSDVVGSRSIWYYKDAEYFIASTSQRAMVMFLGDFKFNNKVIPWMLSTGSLGPFLSWDKRFNLLSPDASLLLNKENWEAQIKSVPIIYESKKMTKKGGYDLVLGAIKETFDQLDLDYEKWAITLSGGKDSRGILLSLLAKSEEAKKIKTFTHGHRGSQGIKGTDGYIAKKIADKYGISNDFFSAMSLSEEESMEAINERILKVGEGRVDHLAAYLDGFSFWKHLFESKSEGILRGDIGFGFPLNIKFKTETEANKISSFYTCDQWANLSNLEKVGMPKQNFPDEFKPRQGESMNVYHDRIYASYRMPMVMAALSDFKLSYVEVMCPLLSRKIINSVRILPENLRLGSPIWTSYVNQMEKNIPYSFQDSHDPLDREDLKKEFYKFKKKYIRESPYLPEYLKGLVPPTKQEKSNGGIRTYLKGKMKSSLTKKQKFYIWKLLGGNHKKEAVPADKLINRLFILSDMPRILHSDANLDKSKNWSFTRSNKNLSV